MKNVVILILIVTFPAFAEHYDLNKIAEAVENDPRLKAEINTSRSLIQIADDMDDELRALGAKVSIDPDGVYAKYHYKMPDGAHVVCERGFLYGSFHHSCSELYPGSGPTPKGVKPFPS